MLPPFQAEELSRRTASTAVRLEESPPASPPAFNPHKTPSQFVALDSEHPSGTVLLGGFQFFHL